MNMDVKGQLINFPTYIKMAEVYAQGAIWHKVEEMLVAADCARDSLYRIDPNNSELARMSNEISAARKKLLARG